MMHDQRERRLLDDFEDVVTRLLNVTSALEAIISAASPAGLSPEQLATIKALTETLKASTARQATVVAENQPDSPQT